MVAVTVKTQSYVGKKEEEERLICQTKEEWLKELTEDGQEIEEDKIKTKKVIQYGTGR